ncbi:MAG: hypothetical protein WDZ91_07835 [Paenibacillaceae bacterium]
MFQIMTCYETLRKKKHLSELDCSLLMLGNKLHSYQYASLVCQLVHAELNEEELCLLKNIICEFPIIINFIHLTHPNHEILMIKDIQWRKMELDYTHVFSNTYKYGSIGKIVIEKIIDDFVADRLDLDFLAYWLMTVCIRDISKEDLVYLTDAMKNSGAIFDYRNNRELAFAKVIRRYPTGALSEKTALILPSLLAAVSKDYKICSPFLVARSLGFTGGTWDKLNSIPGFRMPQPGNETMSVLKNCSVAMSVTHGDANPADRKMYQFRSLTGTIESSSLIISSIASKQLVMPADFLLMDVRYGNGAFFETYEEAKIFAISLCEVIELGGVSCSYLLIDTPEPNGSSIGNALEVLEAIEVMRPHSDKSKWDERKLIWQKELVLGFFSELMHAIYPDKKKQEWFSHGLLLFKEGKVLEAFNKILKAHSVSLDTIQSLNGSAWDVICPYKPSDLYANSTGRLVSIDQKRLGFLVNFYLGAGGNEFGGEFCPQKGILVCKALGDEINKGELICEIYSDEIKSDFVHELSKCFVIECI